MVSPVGTGSADVPRNAFAIRRSLLMAETLFQRESPRKSRGGEDGTGSSGPGHPATSRRMAAPRAFRLACLGGHALRRTPGTMSEWLRIQGQLVQGVPGGQVSFLDAYPPARSLEREGSVGADTLPLPFPRDPCLFIAMNRVPPSSDCFTLNPLRSRAEQLSPDRKRSELIPPDNATAVPRFARVSDSY
jgi:hypothetical protein